VSTIDGNRICSCCTSPPVPHARSLTLDFPWKLHTMLEEVETYNQQHIVSWQPDGTSFRVFRPEEFVQQIMPHYFHQTQYRSFQRMLNLYEFQKRLNGKYRGSYSHPNFIRSDRELCLQMRIRKKPKKEPSSTPSRKPAGKLSSAEKKPKAVSTGSPGGTRLTPLQQHHLQQQLMTRGGLMPRGSPGDTNSLLQQRHNFFQQGGGLGYSMYPPMIASSAGAMIPPSDQSASAVFGPQSSGQQYPLQSDLAALHHHQPFPQNFALKSDGDYQSQKIQISQRSPVPPQRGSQQGLNLLSAAWNTTINASSYDSELATLDEDERVHPAPVASSADFAARLKATEDPLSVASGASIPARHHPLFGASQQLISVRSSTSFFAQNSMSGGERQRQQYQQHLFNLLQPQPQQQQSEQIQGQPENEDDAMFRLPLSSDLEPNPFP
jgi:HSF-type DNA-binding